MCTNSMKWDLRFLGLAAHIAGWSKDPSTKCGAVVVRANRTVASMGYNGFPRGVIDNLLLLEDREEKYKRVVHAEMNALLFLRESIDRGYTLYTWPFPPCDRCATCLINTGVGRVVSPCGSGPLWDRHNVSLTRELLKMAQVELQEVKYEVSGSSGHDAWTAWNERK